MTGVTVGTRVICAVAGTVAVAVTAMTGVEAEALLVTVGEGVTG